MEQASSTGGHPVTEQPDAPLNIARRPEDLLDRRLMVEMSGLDYLQGLMAGRFAHPPIAALMNYRLVRAEDGLVAFRATPAFDHCNPMGTVHGGWYGTVMDSALGCAVMTRVPQGQWYTTLEYRINLVRAVPIGAEVEAVARVRHAGRSTAVAEAEMLGVADGRLYATGSTTCLILAG
jgi:uncharacterized protein (TIGR00369 family)